jgi:hypothetical protein
VAPGENAFWTAGETHRVEWISEGNPGPGVDLLLFDWTGDEWVGFLHKVLPNDCGTNSFNWFIPFNVPPGQYRLRLHNGTDSTPFVDSFSRVLTIVDPPYNVSPLVSDEWVNSSVSNQNPTEIFSVEVMAGAYYVLSIFPGVETESVPNCDGRAEVTVLDSEGNILDQESITVAHSTKQLSWEAPATGSNFIRVSLQYFTCPSNPSALPDIQLYLSRVRDDVQGTLELLELGDARQALDQVRSLLIANPNDPELNLEAALLLVLDRLENPDSELVRILNAYQVELDILPDSILTVPTEIPNSALNLSAIQNYAVNEMLPLIDGVLEHLEKVSVDMNRSFQVPGRIGSDIEKWFRVDIGDLWICKGGLRIAQAGIHLLNAYNLNVNPNLIEDALNTPFQPSDIERELNRHPALGRGKPTMPTSIEQALSHWQDGSGELRKGIRFKIDHLNEQRDNLFILDDPDDGQNALNMLTFVDRVCESLAVVTSGDMNGDGELTAQDLLILQAFWKSGSR